MFRAEYQSNINIAWLYTNLCVEAAVQNASSLHFRRYTDDTTPVLKGGPNQLAYSLLSQTINRICKM